MRSLQKANGPKVSTDRTPENVNSRSVKYPEWQDMFSRDTQSLARRLVMQVAVLCALLTIVLISSFPRAFAGVAIEMNPVSTDDVGTCMCREDC
jgi:hypothetical protein